MSLALALVRALHFASLMIVFGSEALQALFRTRLSQPPQALLANRTRFWLVLLALATAVLWFLSFASQLDGPDASFGLVAVWPVAKGTLFGRVFVVRLLLLVPLLATSQWAHGGPWRIALSGAALAAMALTSHAAASGDPQTMLARAANDAVHLLAAGFWVGGLSVLVPLAIANRKTPRMLLARLQLFSVWGMVAVGFLIAAGSLNAYLILRLPTRWSIAYVSLLTVKILLAALMIALALTNRFGLLPGIRRGADGAQPESLVVSTSVELATGLLIVVIVGFLGTMSPWQT